MANLLPLIEKKLIRKEYRVRLAVVAALLIASLVSISVILLAPTFILSSYKYSSATNQLNTEKKKISDSAEGIDPIKTAKEVNAQLVVLGGEGSLLPLSYDVFTTIVGYKPGSIKIESMFYDRGQISGRISVGGVSKDRETLLSFLQSLEGEEMFDIVELPISSFVEGEDIEFSIQLTIDKGSDNTEKNNTEENG